tara:strand:+ start:130 stop:534 length:405 start_codon:yes stop_codon:yes gene_type:complete
MAELTPFDFLNSVSETKEELIRNEEGFRQDHIEKQYVPYMVNRGLSNHIDTIMYANEMNQLHHLPKDAQYRYFLTVVRRGKRRGAWPKKSSDTALLDIIQKELECNRTVARQYLKVMTQEQIDTLNKRMTKGGH